MREHRNRPGELRIPGTGFASLGLTGAGAGRRASAARAGIRRWSAALLPLLLAGCAPATAELRTETFAPSLQVNLDAMDRTPSGLYYRDTRPGTGAEARRGSRVAVYFAGWLADGTQVDALVEPEPPLEFRVGSGDVVQGWEEGVVGMREGGQRQLVVPSRLAYGSRAVGQIPRNSDLVFLIELVEVR